MMWIGLWQSHSLSVRCLATHTRAVRFFALQSDGAITSLQADLMHEQLQLLLATIHDLSAAAWIRQKSTKSDPVATIT